MGSNTTTQEIQTSSEEIIHPEHSFKLAYARIYGSIEKALLMGEIEQMQVYKQRNGKSEWVFYSAKGLAEKFPYMKRSSIDHWLRQLVKAGHLESRIKNKTAYDKTRSYRLPTLAKNEQSIANDEPSIANDEQPIPSLSTPLSKGGNTNVLPEKKIPTTDITELLEYWESATDMKLGNETGNRKAIAALLRQHGKANLKRLVDGVVLTFEDQYAPHISDFVSLKRKQNDLLTWGRRNKRNNATVAEI